MRTSAWPGPGSGVSTSTSDIFSGPPGSFTWTHFTAPAYLFCSRVVQGRCAQCDPFQVSSVMRLPINKATVSNLRIAWRQSATPGELRKGRPDPPTLPNYQNTPVMVDGVLYIGTGYGNIAALDGATGKVIWFDDPPKRPGQTESRVPTTRGVAYWTDGRDARVVAVAGHWLVSLNAKTGKRYA